MFDAGIAVGQSVVIDHEPFIMETRIVVTGAETALSVYVSTMVHPESETLSASRDIIENQCVRLTEKRLVHDPGMYQQKAWRYEYIVFNECPVNISHRCARIEVECPTTKICIAR